MDITKVGIIGVGTMGGALALLLADNGVHVSVLDTSEASMRRTVANAEAAGLASMIHTHNDYGSFCQSLPEPKVFIFSLPHGRPGDAVVETLKQFVTEGDIVIDGSNENYKVTQTRQETLRPLRASLVGLGISGGSAGARNGPSLMPGGDRLAVERVLPVLTRIAARDDLGRPCVANIGTGGSGHFVKMIHNGIEHGVMSALCEAWELMDACLDMDGHQIGAVFDTWCAEGELQGNFLVSISGPICRTRSSNGGGSYLLHQIRDAVVQDANDSEGTGVWANLQAVSSHVAAPSLTAAHYLRIASSDLHQRAAVYDSIGTISPRPLGLSGDLKARFIEQLRQAVYLTTLVCFAQGLDILDRENRREGWGVHVPSVLRIWRAGCIIKSDHLSDVLEESYDGTSQAHPLCRPLIAAEVKRCWPSLKSVLVQGVQADAHLPCLGSSLEYLKYIGAKDLPTRFVEAQLDSFGEHGFDLETEPVRHLLKGIHHESWSGLQASL